jgi:hypothetical protein
MFSHDAEDAPAVDHDSAVVDSGALPKRRAHDQDGHEPFDASTTVARARSIASRSASCSKRSSIAYPERQSSGNTATATDF